MREHMHWKFKSRYEQYRSKSIGRQRSPMKHKSKAHLTLYPSIGMLGNEVTSNRRDQRNDSHFLSLRADRHNQSTFIDITNGGLKIDVIIVAISHVRNNESRE